MARADLYDDYRLTRTTVTDGCAEVVAFSVIDISLEESVVRVNALGMRGEPYVLTFPGDLYPAINQQDKSLAWFFDDSPLGNMPSALWHLASPSTH
jgi:hypothetical protein